jgi:hypothetical protein
MEVVQLLADFKGGRDILLYCDWTSHTTYDIVFQWQL